MRLCPPGTRPSGPGSSRSRPSSRWSSGKRATAFRCPFCCPFAALSAALSPPFLLSFSPAFLPSFRRLSAVLSPPFCCPFRRPFYCPFRRLSTALFAAFLLSFRRLSAVLSPPFTAVRPSTLVARLSEMAIDYRVQGKLYKWCVLASAPSAPSAQR